MFAGQTAKLEDGIMNRTGGILAICLVVALPALVPWKGAAKHRESREKLGIAERVENVFLAQEKAALTRLLHAALGTLEQDSDLVKVKKILAHQAEFAK